MDLLRRDLPLAARLLWKDRSFAATAGAKGAFLAASEARSKMINMVTVPSPTPEGDQP